ncbi:DUF1552 domain-containing protein [Rubritalea sp.]|uniref:DUF1552 domain-containing protein n=1 Tax=Rubritalea sp. TaxID=2109375 RepID=UPI003EF71891
MSRRHVLRGAGATMALPFLEAMGATTPIKSLAVGPEGQPIRYAAIMMPNGLNNAQFTPTGSSLDNLPPILQPLGSFAEHVNVITGLRNEMGGHAGSTSGFLTGNRPGKATSAAEVNTGNASIDQVIGYAEKDSTALPTLELAMHTPRRGISPSGLPWVYGNCISWRNATTPVPQEVNPMRAFMRLFEDARLTSKPSTSRKKGFTPTKSVIDSVLDDAKQLQKRLGRDDQQKLDEYLTTVRDVENRILRKTQPKGLKITEEIFADIQNTGKKIKRSSGRDELSVIPKIPFPEYTEMMMDIMALAFWSNSTRASTLMLGHGVCRRNMSFLDGVEGEHHSISHHGNNPDKMQQQALINTFYVSQYTYFLERLHSMKEGSNSVLENSVVMMGSSIGNGQNHSRGDLGIILGGNAGGRIKTNRHIEGAGAPLSTLHRSVLDTLNIEDQFKNKGGTLQGI